MEEPNWSRRALLAAGALGAGFGPSLIAQEPVVEEPPSQTYRGFTLPAEISCCH